MSKVFLREKRLKHGKKSLYLDFYPPIINPETKKPTRREHLKLYIYERPKTEDERDHNKETKILGEHIRAQRQLEIQASDYGFLRHNKKKDFIEYFKRFVESKKPKDAEASTSLYSFFVATLNHLKKFAGEVFPFGNVTEKFCQDFREYLLNRAKLSQNSAALYFDRFRAVISQAVKDKLLPESPTVNVKPIQTKETQREFLTLKELTALANTPFSYEDLRRAALFSAMTGLRFSDIEKLIWSEIQHDSGQDYIRFRQKKTGGAETLPISAEARELLGERKAPEAKVFQDLNYSQTIYLPIWTAKAGIDRHITFHAFRHSNAVLQISLGTDIYTLQKMLGHKDIKTTQLYAKVLDLKKQEAANKISLK